MAESDNRRFESCGEYGKVGAAEKGSDPRMVLPRLRYEAEEYEFRINKQLEYISRLERAAAGAESERREAKFPTGWFVGALSVTVPGLLLLPSCFFGVSLLFLAAAVVLWIRFLSELLHRKRVAERDLLACARQNRELNEARDELNFTRSLLLECRRRISALEREQNNA